MYELMELTIEVSEANSQEALFLGERLLRVLQAILVEPSAATALTPRSGPDDKIAYLIQVSLRAADAVALGRVLTDGLTRNPSTRLTLMFNDFSFELRNPAEVEQFVCLFGFDANVMRFCESPTDVDRIKDNCIRMHGEPGQAPSQLPAPPDANED